MNDPSVVIHDELMAATLRMEKAIGEVLAALDKLTKCGEFDAYREKQRLAVVGHLETVEARVADVRQSASQLPPDDRHAVVTVDGLKMVEKAMSDVRLVARPTNWLRPGGGFESE